MRLTEGRFSVRREVLVGGCIAIAATLLLAAGLRRVESESIDPAFGMKLLGQVQASLAQPGGSATCLPDRWFQDDPQVRDRILAANGRWYILFRPANEIERRVDFGDRDVVTLLREHRDDVPLSVEITLEDGECVRFGAAQWEE